MSEKEAAGGMSDDKFQRIVRQRIDTAIAHAAELGTDREKATRYARGDISQDLPNIDGRSRVVSMDLRDTVMEIMPSLIRMYCGKKPPVEFEPTGEEDEESAQQATDYANYIFQKKCNGLLFCWDVFQNALIRRLGPAKVWWDSSKSVTAKRYANIDPETFALMQQAVAPGEEIVEPEADAQGNVSFVLKTEKNHDGMRAESMPPEELIYTPNSKNLERPLLIGQYTRKTVGELVALDYPLEEMLQLADASGEMDAEDQARRDYSTDNDDSDGDATAREVDYVEAYTLIDRDGDGIPEYRKVCCIGPARKVYAEEMVSDHPFVNYVIYPEPHTAEGLSLFDILRDLVLIRSQLLRLGLDGLSSVITPRQKFKRGAVDLKQLVDARPGGVVGCNEPSTDLMSMDTDKSAPQLAMQAYDQMGQVRTARTGQQPGAAGLTPDVLQSTTRIQANDVVQRAQASVELIARMLAEGHRRTFKLLLQGITQYQDKAETIRLRGKWVPMDPSRWNPDMDVTPNVGLGNGNVEEQAMAAQVMLQVQQAIMEKAGPVNPWTNAEKIRKTLFDLAEVSGRTPESYFLTADEWFEAQQKQAQQPPTPPQPDPLVQAAQVEAEAKVRSDKYKTDTDNDFKRDQLLIGAVEKAIEKGATPQEALQWGQILNQLISAPRSDAGTQMQGVQ